MKISTAVGVAPALISATLGDPNFSVKHASCAGVIVAGLTPTDSRAFFCESDKPEVVFVVEPVLCDVFVPLPKISGFILNGSTINR